jgi:hypothetical protein
VVILQAGRTAESDYRETLLHLFFATPFFQKHSSVIHMFKSAAVHQGKRRLSKEALFACCQVLCFRIASWARNLLQICLTSICLRKSHICTCNQSDILCQIVISSPRTRRRPMITRFLLNRSKPDRELYLIDLIRWKDKEPELEIVSRLIHHAE